MTVKQLLHRKVAKKYDARTSENLVMLADPKSDSTVSIVRKSITSIEERPSVIDISTKGGSVCLYKQKHIFL